MSAEMIERTYGHHHPDYMRRRAGHHVETTAEPFIGCFIGRAGKGLTEKAENLIFYGGGRSHCRNLSQRPNSLVSGKNTGNCRKLPHLPPQAVSLPSGTGKPDWRNRDQYLIFQ